MPFYDYPFSPRWVDSTHISPNYSLTLITPIASLPIALTDIKAHLNIVGNQDDTRLNRLQWTAIDFCERYLNRALLTQTWMMSFRLFERLGQPFDIRLPKAPAQSITNIKYYDTNNVQQTLNSSLYQLITDTNLQGRLVKTFNSVLPDCYDRVDAVQITWTAGYSTLPRNIENAIYLMVSNWNEQREAEGSNQLKGITFGVERLLDSYETGSYS